MAARVSSPLELPPGVVEWVGFVPGQEKEPGTARRRPIVFVFDVEYLARKGEAREGSQWKSKYYGFISSRKISLPK